MLGADYLIDHCIKELRERMAEKVYREYLTDAIMNIGETAAKAFGGRYLQVRYADLIGEDSEDGATADEIVLDVMRRAGLKTRGETNGSNDTQGEVIA